MGRQLPRLERLPLMELAGRLAGCRAYLGNDSGVSHLAGLCGARTVALFGPTPSSVWRPLGPRVAVFPFSASSGQLLGALGR
jgi:ADP-heptose:LPS heptosyltransferase